MILQYSVFVAYIKTYTQFLQFLGCHFIDNVTDNHLQCSEKIANFVQYAADAVVLVVFFDIVTEIARFFLVMDILVFKTFNVFC